MSSKIKNWDLSGVRKKIRLNKHTITIIDAVPKNKRISLEEGEAKLRKILQEANS